MVRLLWWRRPAEPAGPPTEPIPVQSAEPVWRPSSEVPDIGRRIALALGAPGGRTSYFTARLQMSVPVAVPGGDRNSWLVAMWDECVSSSEAWTCWVPIATVRGWRYV
jgi:hypothetical protein